MGCSSVIQEEFHDIVLENENISNRSLMYVCEEQNLISSSFIRSKDVLGQN